MTRQVASARLPTSYGDFACHVWEALGVEHLAIVRGDLRDPQPALVRVHSECLTGDVLASRRCDCGTQLHDALRLIAREQRGVVVYLRGHEGRGIGLGHKLEAYHLQDLGHDTVEANLRLGFPVDARDYGVAAEILGALGVRSARLMTNNPEKCRALSRNGIAIAERVPLPARATGDNVRYLRTKQQRMGHLLDVGPE